MKDLSKGSIHILAFTPKIVDKSSAVTYLSYMSKKYHCKRYKKAVYQFVGLPKGSADIALNGSSDLSFTNQGKFKTSSFPTRC